MASYLINNLSFSPSEAESISSKHFAGITSTSNPDAVVSFLRRDAHLSPSQLRRFLRLRPSLLLSSVPSTLLPKLGIFRSLLPSGSPPAALASLVSSCAASFGHPLSRLLPALSLLRDLLLHDHHKLLSALRRCPRLLASHPDKVIARNAGLLRPSALNDPVTLAHSIHRSPIVLTLSPPRLVLAVSIVKREFGIGDHNCINSVAMAATLTEKGFMERIEILRRFGFKEEDMLVLFRRNPNFMSLKVDHVVRKLEFFSGEVGFGPREMIHSPWVLTLGLETRLIPRHNLVKALMERGLVAADVDMRTAFMMSEEQFGESISNPILYLTSLEAKEDEAASPW